MVIVNDGSLDKKNKELIAFINREGYELDWQETEEQTDNSQILLQEKLYADFQDNAYKALFYFGFSNHSIPMSDSVHFLRSIAAAFKNCFNQS